MPDVKCADDGCRFNDGTGRCTADKIALSWHSIVTVWDGRQEFHRCKMRESPAQYRRRQRERENGDVH